jgi:hypothetical protein
MFESSGNDQPTTGAKAFFYRSCLVEHGRVPRGKNRAAAERSSPVKGRARELLLSLWKAAAQPRLLFTRLERPWPDEILRKKSSFSRSPQTE